MKIAYITAQVPWGRGETFILEEMLAVKRARAELLIIPRNPTKQVFHTEADALLGDAVWMPLINPKMIGIFFLSLLIKPYLWQIINKMFRYSRTRHILVKNLTVMPKGVYMAYFLKTRGVKHIHAHWGSTTATMAYIASQLSGIPWSFTLHRWDIVEDNMLKEKVESAEFVRCISEHGKNELIGIIGKSYEEKIRVVHVGVKVPKNISECGRKKYNLHKFTIVTPANLLEIKGHKYLIEACSILIKQDIRNFQCIFYGDGPLRIKLNNFIKEKRLSNYIKMPGAVPHEKLMAMYKNHEADLVILPSITTNRGEHEGIPVSLMEAMAYGIPVISTNTGGIPELIGDNSGIMVEEKNAKAIADAIKRLMLDENFYYTLGLKGREKILKEFNIQDIIEDLLSLFKRGE